VLIGERSQQPPVAAFRFCKLSVRLLFCHFVVMSELEANVAKCSAASANARPPLS
jgi:hypothetical protein